MSWLHLGVVAFTAFACLLSGVIVSYHERKRRTRLRFRRVVPIAPMLKPFPPTAGEAEELSRVTKPIEVGSALPPSGTLVELVSWDQDAPTRAYAVSAEQLAELSVERRASTVLSSPGYAKRAPAKSVPAQSEELPPTSLFSSQRWPRPVNEPVADSSLPLFPPDRCHEDITLRIGRRATTPSREQAYIDELVGMLGAAPTPSLGNVEIYYRLGLAYLAQGDRGDARRSFEIVEDISPGYRDVTAHLSELSSEAPEASDARPLHFGRTSSGAIPVHRAPAPNIRESARRRRN